MENQELLENWWRLCQSENKADNETAKQMIWLQGRAKYIKSKLGILITICGIDFLEILHKRYIAIMGIDKFPLELFEIKKLQTIDFSCGKMNKVPDEIAILNDLKELRTICLRGNPIPKTEHERIRALLPNCTIDF